MFCFSEAYYKVNFRWYFSNKLLFIHIFQTKSDAANWPLEASQGLKRQKYTPVNCKRNSKNVKSITIFQ